MKIFFVCLLFFPLAVLADYDRDAFGSWLDVDRDGRNMRHEILSFAESLDGGQDIWYLPYSNCYESKSRVIDIDHVVPLRHAYGTGAADWYSVKKKQFANDPLNLVVTHRSVNRSKGSRAPHEWMPPFKRYHCQYLYRWRTIKDKYGLSYSSDERKFLKRRMRRCILRFNVLEPKYIPMCSR